MEKIPQGALKSRPVLPGQAQSSQADEDAIVFAYRFYGITLQPPSVNARHSDIPFAVAFEDVVSLSSAAAKALLDGPADPSLARSQRDVLLLSLSLLDMLLSRQEDEGDVIFSVNWDPTGWLSTLLACLAQTVCADFGQYTWYPLSVPHSECGIRDRGPLHHSGNQDSWEDYVAARVQVGSTCVHGTNDQCCESLYISHCGS